MKLTMILGSILLATAAHAAPELGCRDVDTLNRAVHKCGANKRYSKEGKKCLASFSLFRADEKAKALRALDALAAPNATASLELSEKSLAEARKTLQPVIDLGVQTEGRVSDYLHNLLYPEDWDAPREVIGDPKKFFDAHTCYSGPRDRLEAQLDQVHTSVLALKEAIQKAELKVAALRVSAKAK